MNFFNIFLSFFIEKRWAKCELVQWKWQKKISIESRWNEFTGRHFVRIVKKFFRLNRSEQLKEFEQFHSSWNLLVSHAHDNVICIIISQFMFIIFLISPSILWFLDYIIFNLIWIGSLDSYFQVRYWNFVILSLIDVLTYESHHHTHTHTLSILRGVNEDFFTDYKGYLRQ